MSDSLRTYSAVKHRICQTLSDEHRYRVTNLSLMVSGVVRSRRVQQSQVAGEMPLTCQDKSLVQLAWSVRKGQKGHFPTTEHLKVVGRAAAHLPAQAPVVLLGDGEFGHIALAQAAQTQDWDLVLRTARDDLVWIEGEASPLSEFQVGPDETLWLEDVLWTKAQFDPVNVAITWNEKDEALMYLVSSFELLGETLYWYHRRSWVEPVFRDDKSMGLNLQKSSLRDPKRMMRLLLVVCLAYLWVMFLGCMALISGCRHLIDRKDWRDGSLFTYGLRWLRRLLKIDAYLPVRFCPYPFLRLLQTEGIGW